MKPPCATTAGLSSGRGREVVELQDPGAPSAASGVYSTSDSRLPPIWPAIRYAKSLYATSLAPRRADGSAVAEANPDIPDPIRTAALSLLASAPPEFTPPKA